jgi:hypothetical protein
MRIFTTAVLAIGFFLSGCKKEVRAPGLDAYAAMIDDKDFREVVNKIKGDPAMEKDVNEFIHAVEDKIGEEGRKIVAAAPEGARAQIESILEEGAKQLASIAPRFHAETNEIIVKFHNLINILFGSVDVRSMVEVMIFLNGSQKIENPEKPDVDKVISEIVSKIKEAISPSNSLRSDLKSFIIPKLFDLFTKYPKLKVWFDEAGFETMF